VSVSQIETDKELLDYIETHSHTELALVSNKMVRRLLELAREPMPENLKNVAFISCKHENIKDIVARARRYMNLRLVK
jgi:negative regulator of replication initiation